MTTPDPTPVHPAREDAPGWAPHPAHRHEFADPALAAVLLNWSKAAAGIPTPAVEVIDPDPVCTTCGDTGFYTHRNYLTGRRTTSTCPTCDGGAQW